MLITTSRVRLPRPGQRDMCVHAQKFSSWVEDLLDKTDMQDRMRIHQSLLQLAMQHYQWYFQVPPKHQSQAGPQGHVCIFHVYIHAFNDLMEARADLDPPVYTPPPPPPKIVEREVPVPVIPSFSDEGTLSGLNIGVQDG